MIFVKVLNSIMDLFPPVIQGFIGLVVIGMMLIMPDIIIVIALLGIFYSMVYSIYHWSASRLFNYIMTC